MENEEIKHHIQEFIQKWHIRPNSSPCGSPIVLVDNKYRTWRLSIVYQALNKIIAPNRYPIPRMDELLKHLKGAKYFSKNDPKFVYHQVLTNHIDV